MKNQDAVEVVTVQKAEEQLGLSHGKIVSLIAEGKLKWTTVEGSVHVELPRNQRRREALIKKSQ